MSKLNYDSFRNLFLSKESKLRTMELLEAGINREPTRDEVAGLFSTMLSCDIRFYRQHDTLLSAQKHVASFVGKQIIERSNRSNIRQAHAHDISDEDNEFDTEDEERSDPDEPVYELLKRECQKAQSRELIWIGVWKISLYRD